ncbi:LOW QUALITY PROTEIN: latent-transforming growth factor beta-binding protein 4-like [Heptranchias perlo]|uniref:LOW QUALITY PROTEIN: latent-transforming growth factor beta-binding protein 4-like n=1 Tax=Heptranchias perlo TaxID=212740 RepID=UPI00355A155D
MSQRRGFGAALALGCCLLLALLTRDREPSVPGNRRSAPGRPRPRLRAVSLNVCGGECCTGWVLGPRTGKCTKPVCSPRCQNGGLCRRPHTCVCRLGFQGPRCETVTDLHLPTNLTSPPPRARPVPTSSVGHARGGKRERAVGKKASSVRYVGRKKSTVRWRPLTVKQAQSVLLRKLPLSGQWSVKPPAVVVNGQISPSSGATHKTKSQAPKSNVRTSGTGQSTVKQSKFKAWDCTLLSSFQRKLRTSLQTPNDKVSSAEKCEILLELQFAPWTSQGGGGPESSGIPMDLEPLVVLCCALFVSPAFNQITEVGKIKVLFTPTVCKVKCEAGHCENRCRKGNITAVYSDSSPAETAKTGFRVFLCLLRCQNGGVCVRKDRCMCTPGFTGKFCQIPAPSASSQVADSFPTGDPDSERKSRVQTVYTLPLSNQQLPDQTGRLIPSIVNLRVHHPPHVSVKVHQVTQVDRETHANSAQLSTNQQTSQRAQQGAQQGHALQERQGTLAVAPRSDGESVFGYCFTEITNGQCASPLSGLRTVEHCCRGGAVGWGVTECIECPVAQGGDCPVPLLKTADGQCQDIDECSAPEICQNGRCLNVRGGYSCVCSPGFVQDTSKSQCISQQVISLTRGPCYRIWRIGSCSLPVLQNITKQICCCSRVGKGWGPTCQKCPSPLSDGFREICPAGPGYHYTRTPPPRQPANGRERGRGLATADHHRHRQSTPAPRLRGTTSLLTTSAVPRTPTPAPEVHICQRAPQVCGPGRCVTRQQGYTCTCNTGFQLNLQRSRCVDTDECRQSPQPCPNGRCKNTAGSFRCVCSRGFTANSHGTDCIDIDECLDVSACPNSECINSLGSFRCLPCPTGYKIHNRKCSDVNECVTGATCGDTGVCVNTEGSYHCDCNPGYRLSADTNQCADINECFEGDFCAPYGECLNTVGTYTCLCAEGFVTSADLSTCLDVDECTREGVCDRGRCTNTVGSFECSCEAGFRVDEDRSRCTDLDECVEYPNICGSKRCENRPGSFQCITECGVGYLLSPAQDCIDIDECVNATVCGPYAYCQNVAASFQCHCDQGYQRAPDGSGCVDVNECEVMEGVCGTAVCENVGGSFFCLCPDGKEEFDPRTGRCILRDIHARPVFTRGPAREENECYYNLNDGQLCENVLARNVTRQECCCTVGEGWGSECQIYHCPVPGSDEYQSLCPQGQGFLSIPQSPFGRNYKDADECSLFGSEVCKNGVCVNTIPGFSCYCPSGYYYESVRLECIDNDECDDDTACDNGDCVNTVGSYYCRCNPPLVLDPTFHRCVSNASELFDVHMALCWQEVGLNLLCKRPFLERPTTYTECCCQYGEAWGMDCALCPTRNTADLSNEDIDKIECLSQSSKMKNNSVFLKVSFFPKYNSMVSLTKIDCTVS